MSTQLEDKRSRLRTLVGTVDAAVTADDGAATRTAWKELVTALDLGPVPETRTCPKCGGIGMRAATRCGHCWVALSA